MNLPGDKIHHIALSYGWLLLPWFGGQWLAWMRGMNGTTVRPGLHLISAHFHNCRRYGA